MKAILLVLFSLFTGWCFSQVVIHGKVMSARNPVPFAHVCIDGTTTCTTTDIDGNFKLSSIEKASACVATCVGFEKRNYPLTWTKDTAEILIEMASTALGLGEVVVSGSMKETFVSNSPVKIEVITSKFLQKAPTNNLMEALQTVNGVQEQVNCGVCNTSDIHINGMEGPYTLVLIDGMPIMSALSTVYGLNGIPTSLIERIEIIKGPSSTLYGSEAVAGLINVITKKHEDVPLVSVNAFASTHLEKNLDFAFAPSLKRTNILFSGNYYQMKNFIDENNDNFSDVALADRLSLFNKWSINRKSAKPFNISSKYYYEDRYGGEKEWNKKYRGSDSIYGESIYTNRYELIGNYEFNTREKIKLDISLNGHWQNSFYGKTKYDAEQQTAFSRLTWNKRLGGRHDILSGITNKIQSYNDNTPATVEGDLTSIPGIFVQDEWTYLDNLSFMGGLRYDYHKDHRGIVSPALNIKYKPYMFTTLRLNAGKGFRVVNLFTEDHAVLTGARTVLIKERLSPEESYNVTLNWNQVLNIKETAVTVDVDGFYTYFTNKIVPDYLTDENLIIYNNLNGYSISRGISMAFSQSYKIPLHLSAGATYLDVFSVEANAENDMIREKQLFTPLISGVFTASYKLKRIRTSIDYTGKVVGPMVLPVYDPPFSRAETSNWFTLQNIQITHTFKKSFEVFLSCKNLFDYTQESPLIDPANPFGPAFDTSYMYGPTQGRRYFIGFRYSLGRKDS